MDLRDVLLAAALTTAFLVLFGPAIGFSVTGSVIQYPPYPYLSTAFTSGLWMLYARDWSLGPLLWLSTIGSVMGTLYVLIFMWRSDPADARRTYLRRYARHGSAVFVVAIGSGLVFPKSSVYGVVCCVAACAASVAPLCNVRRALRERSMDCMPSVYIPRFTLPNSVLWIAINTTTGGGWNWKETDKNLLVASLVAGLCALGQLLLHVRIGRLQREVPSIDQLAVQMQQLNLEGPENDADADEDAPLLP